MKIIIPLIQALLFIVSSFSVQDSNFKLWVDRAAYAMSSKADISFESIEADELDVSEAEKKRCREWYEENILTTTNPAYNFKVGIKQLQNNVDDWDFEIGKESEVGAVQRGGKTTYITLTHKKSDLVATVEATIYEEHASCEWTVFIENTGDEKSPVVSDFYGADCTLPTGKKTEFYFSKGTDPAPDDFELLKSDLSLLVKMKFTANGGRTDSFMPYFNLIGKDGGVVLANGWSGQWYTSLKQTLDGTAIQVKQEKLKGYLNPDESIRSPLVSLTFYNTDNPLKGFNSFRNYTMDCIYPEDTKQITTTGIAIESLEAMYGTINNLPEDWIPSLDYFWIDAGWYPYPNEWHEGAGDWFPNPDRFGDGDGFAQATKYALSKGMKTLLWYEPERCVEGTEIYEVCKANEGWLLKGTYDRNIVNFANDDCLEYMTNYMLDSLRELNIKGLRMDSNFTALPFWQEADKNWGDGRKGFTENHYVTNLYAFIDTLMTEIPDLFFDNCCSGGKRIDIEMSKRGIPLWRSDYNCMDGEGNSQPDILQATQAQTYGISFWVPYNGTCAYITGEYANRTNIISCSQLLDYYELRPYMIGNYYPLTYGGTDTKRYLAMQFDNDGEGMALIYKREDVKNNSYTLKLNGLDPEKIYELYDYDNPEAKIRLSGEMLMSDGYKLTINDTPKAVIILYKAV